MSVRYRFHSVAITQCGNYENLLSHNFDNNFVKVTFLLDKDVTEQLFDEIVEVKACKNVKMVVAQK